MRCGCAHEKVCRHRSAIEATVHPIMRTMFPFNHDWNRVEMLVSEVCQFREAPVPKDKEEKEG